MYAANDMELWGGARRGPGRGPWEHYEPVAPTFTCTAGRG